MPDTNLNYLDLDAVAADEREVVVKLNGNEHKLKPVTVADWIANTKLMGELAANEKDVEVEYKAVCTMLVRQFPTMKIEELMGLPMAKLGKILEFARENSGEQKVTESAAQEAKASADANPPALTSVGSISPSSSPASSAATGSQTSA